MTSTPFVRVAGKQEAVVLVPQAWQVPNKVVVLNPAMNDGLTDVPV